MYKDSLQIRALSLVLIGDFNPAIIQPAWLASKKLIRDQEAKDAQIEVIHKEITRIDMDWVFFEVNTGRFELRTSKEPYFEAMRDLMIGIFRFLSETPIRALGINHIMHFGVTDEKKYYDFGNKLTPLSIWEESLSDPRLMRLEIVESHRRDDFKGHYSVKINPSDQKLQTKHGIVININDHFSLQPNQTGTNGEMIDILQNQWNNSFERCNEVAQNLWTKLL